MDGDYAFFVANARKLIWIPALAGACSLLLAKWILPVHLVATAVTVMSALVLNRRALKLGPLLLAMNASCAAPLLITHTTGRRDRAGPSRHRAVFTRAA